MTHAYKRTLTLLGKKKKKQIKSKDIPFRSIGFSYLKNGSGLSHSVPTKYGILGCPGIASQTSSFHSTGRKLSLASFSSIIMSFSEQSRHSYMLLFWLSL